MSYFPHTPDDIEAMLQRCGATSLDELYADVPADLRLAAAGYDLPGAKSESEVRRAFDALRRANRSGLTCFAGAGAYDHYTPAVIAALTSRSEFQTAYTPYQPEISQGTLQYIFEYQSMMSELTGLPVSNASMYDGATATAEAMMMTVNASRRRRRVLVSETINPGILNVLRTYARYHKIELDVIAATDGVTDAEALFDKLGADVAGVIAASPNYYGILEDFSGWADKIHANKSLFVINSPASALAVLRSPGEWGADIACGDAQSLGMPLNYGGPYLGYICSTKALMRKIPGRIVGATTDERGQRAFVLTLQAREQHIRREKATSNICSNQGLMALHTAIYLSLMGPEGMKRINDLSYGGAHRLAEQLTATGKAQLCYPNQPFLNEFAVRFAAPLTADIVLAKLLEHDIIGGVKLSDDAILVAVTEMQQPADIDRYVSIIKAL